MKMEKNNIADTQYQEEWRKRTFFYNGGNKEKANEILKDLAGRGDQKAINLLKYNTALELIENGKEDEGLKIMQELASSGNIYGIRYLSGEYHRLLEANEQLNNGKLYRAIDILQDLPNNDQALLMLGEIYYNNIHNYEKALDCFEKLPLYSNGLGYDYIGLIYLHGLTGVVDYDKAEENFLMSIDYTENPSSYVNLGYVYSMKGNYPKAIECYEMGLQINDSEAQYNMGTFYYHGKGVGKDYKKAAEYYRLAANQGHELAQLSLGELVITGKVLQRVPFKWLIMSLKNMFHSK